MNWLQKINQYEEDPNDPRRNLPDDELYDRTGEDKPQLGDRIYQHYGVWQYPFARVKQDAQEGWYLDWFDFPGSIHDLDKVQPGDKIADSALNMTPYWEVTTVDENKGWIYINPIEPNPFLTGVGAGGAQLTQHDFDVQSGTYEDKRVDQVLKSINDKTYFSPGDIAYLFLGTVPVQMGPNGSQGGWYSPGDVNNNRGGQQGLDPREIMMRDATKFQEMGFSVPPKALDGTLEPRYWGDFVSSGSELRKEGTELPGEDWSNPGAIKNFILNHPDPNIKKRNWAALYQTPPPGVQGPIFRVPDNELRDIILGISQTVHPNQQNFNEKTGANFDPYFSLKESAIATAGQKGWIDVLEQFEGSIDNDVRGTLAYNYGTLKDVDRLTRMTQNETDPKVLSNILRGFRDSGKSPVSLIEQDLAKWIKATTKTGDGWKDYHIEQLGGARISLQDGESTNSFFGGTALVDYLQERSGTIASMWRRWYK